VREADDIVNEIATEVAKQQAEYDLPLLERIARLQADRARLTRERDELKQAIELDRTGLAIALDNIRKTIVSYGWLPAGEWGCYSWHERTEQNFRAEVGRAFDAISELATDALRKSAALANGAFQGSLDRLLPTDAKTKRIEELTRERDQAMRMAVAALCGFDPVCGAAFDGSGAQYRDVPTDRKRCVADTYWTPGTGKRLFPDPEDQ
jgi:hypothetical protein